MERDMLILSFFTRFDFLLGRHVQRLFFSGARACDRRLKLLCENEYLKRQKILYGTPSLYSLTHKGRRKVDTSVRENKIRIDQIHHDIAVVDTMLNMMDKFNLSLSDILTEKQLHSKDGFSSRKHCPDFVFKKDGKTYCVEVELSLKAKKRFLQILKNNYDTYDFQLFFVENGNTKLLAILENNMLIFPNMEVHFFE